jgi:hypothetical protein
VGEIVDLSTRLSQKEEDGPHLSGEATCGFCGHKWVAVAPVGVTHLDCPKCDRRWGLLDHAIEPKTAWACKCGEQLFWVTTIGIMCRRCGELQYGY